LLLGGGLALGAAPSQRLSGLGNALSIYGAFLLAGCAVMQVSTADNVYRTIGHITDQAPWAVACGTAGVILAFTAAATTRRTDAILAGCASGLVLLAPITSKIQQHGDPWLTYAVDLGAVVCLVVSSMIGPTRPRIVAGWLGIAGVIAGITWAVKGSLLYRSAFLAAAGVIAVLLAIALDRLLPRNDE
jgi:hypothetical protein